MMSIASPKLPPLLLSSTTNNNGQHSNSMMRKEVNNNNAPQTSNGLSRPDSPSKRKSGVLNSSDESDDDKPLVSELIRRLDKRTISLGEESSGDRRGSSGEEIAQQWSNIRFVEISHLEERTEISGNIRSRPTRFVARKTKEHHYRFR